MAILNSASSQDVADMTFLSLAAYDRDLEGEPLTAAQAIDGRGWSHIDFTSANSPQTPELAPFAALFSFGPGDGSTWITEADFQDGFYERENAAALLAFKDGTLTIVFRGTDDLLTDGTHLLYDQQAHFELLRPLIEAVLSLIGQQPNLVSKLNITGHSLGGSMAEWFAYEYGADVRLQYLSLNITTVGSPGTNLADPTVPSTSEAVSSIMNFGASDDIVCPTSAPVRQISRLEEWRISGSS